MEVAESHWSVKSEKKQSHSQKIQTLFALFHHWNVIPTIIPVHSNFSQFVDVTTILTPTNVLPDTLDATAVGALKCVEALN